MKAIDLYCCAGGATKGLQRAGFHVTGVDIKPQRNYCGDAFIQADALGVPLDTYDFIWASPPCQAYTTLARQGGTMSRHVDLVASTRRRVQSAGCPYVIENVVGAPLLNPVMLCGTMFPGLRVIRHRLFEASFLMSTPPHRKHPKVFFRYGDRAKPNTSEWTDFVCVIGGYRGNFAAACDAMGIDWMTHKELTQAIPPAYSEYIARQFLEMRAAA